jgi:hypothetical protein
MNQIDLSTFAIVKVILSGIFLYLIAPLLLVARDMALLKIIERWVLTSSLIFEIRLCESDRWHLNNKYQKERSIKIPLAGGGTMYEIDSKQVSSEEYIEYENALKMHQNRFRLLDSKINSRHNLIFWLTQHYKQDGFKSPIPVWRAEAYKRAEQENA